MRKREIRQRLVSGSKMSAKFMKLQYTLCLIRQLDAEIAEIKAEMIRQNTVPVDKRPKHPIPMV